jgi:sec-independent protein translocase protein TatA
MGSIGMPELMVLLVIVLIVFGAGRLPQIGENLGKAIRNFKKSTEKDGPDSAPKRVQ